MIRVTAGTQVGLFNRTYDVSGVRDPDQLQADLVTQCAGTFNRPVRPQVAVERVEGKAVITVFIPELAPTEKPLFLTSLGLPRGAFRRVGPTDQEGTDDDLIALFQGHNVEPYDGSVLRDADVGDFDPEAIRVYRLHLRAMVDGGQLTYTIPAMPNHPDQKYAVPGQPE